MLKRLLRCPRKFLRVATRRCSSRWDLGPCKASWLLPGEGWWHCEGARPASLVQLSLQSGGGWALAGLQASGQPGCCWSHSAFSPSQDRSPTPPTSWERARLAQEWSHVWGLRLWSSWRGRRGASEQVSGWRRRRGGQGDCKWLFAGGICTPPWAPGSPPPPPPPPPYQHRAPGERRPAQASCPAQNPCHHLQHIFVENMKTKNCWRQLNLKFRKPAYLWI